MHALDTLILVPFFLFFKTMSCYIDQRGQELIMYPNLILNILVTYLWILSTGITSMHHL